MQIIIGKETAFELRKRYAVVELETFDVPGKEPVTAYCVLEPENILTDLPDLERLCRLHQALVDAWNNKNYSAVTTGLEHVRGKFGGTLDSFYDILEARIKENNLG